MPHGMSMSREPKLMAFSKNPTPVPSDFPLWMNAGSPARLWLSYWPMLEPAVHTLKLTTVRIHEFGIQFEADHDLPFGTTIHLRLLLPPMTAIAVQGLVIHQDGFTTKSPHHLISVRFTTIRESDRRRLAEFSKDRKPMGARITNPASQGHLSPRSF